MDSKSLESLIWIMWMLHTKIWIVFSFLPLKDMAIVRGELGCFSHPGIGDGGSQKRTEREIDNLWLLSPLEQKIQLYISSTALTMISYLFWEIHKNEIKLLVTFQPPTISKEN